MKKICSCSVNCYLHTKGVRMMEVRTLNSGLKLTVQSMVEIMTNSEITQLSKTQIDRPYWLDSKIWKHECKAVKQWNSETGTDRHSQLGISLVLQKGQREWDFLIYPVSWWRKQNPFWKQKQSNFQVKNIATQHLSEIPCLHRHSWKS